MELVDLQKALGAAESAFRSRQLYDAVYRQKVADVSRISNLSKDLRSRLAEEFSVGLPAIAQSFTSRDGTVRYLLKLADGKTVEAVWMPSFGENPSFDEN